MKNSILFIVLIFLFACSSSDRDSSSGEDSLYKVTIQYSQSNEEIKPDERIIFNMMIDSIYPEIVKRHFDTLAVNSKKEYSGLESHRIVEILIAKKSIKKSDLERIINIYSCRFKHTSVRKKDSEDLVIEEYICKNSDDASFWFNQIYDCYIDHDNPLGEPLKEPYKLWQSNNRLMHIYSRAEMWCTDVDSVNKALMKCFVFSSSMNE